MDLNKVIDYIEKNLTNDITLADICKVASCSDYALRNVFYYLTGLTLSEYIKYRKLSEANKDLLNNEKLQMWHINTVMSQWMGLAGLSKPGVDCFHQKLQN